MLANTLHKHNKQMTHGMLMKIADDPHGVQVMLSGFKMLFHEPKSADTPNTSTLLLSLAEQVQSSACSSCAV